MIVTVLMIATKINPFFREGFTKHYASVRAQAEKVQKDATVILYYTRSLGALWAPTSSWRPFGPLDFILRALRALRPCDPRVGDWIVC